MPRASLARAPVSLPERPGVTAGRECVETAENRSRRGPTIRLTLRPAQYALGRRKYLIPGPQFSCDGARERHHPAVDDMAKSAAPHEPPRPSPPTNALL